MMISFLPDSTFGVMWSPFPSYALNLIICDFTLFKLYANSPSNILLLPSTLFSTDMGFKDELLLLARGGTCYGFNPSRLLTTLNFSAEPLPSLCRFNGYVSAP